MEGEGIFKWKDGSMYKGNFYKGNINGNGIFNWQDGRIYKGEFLNGEIEGKGEFIWPNNHKYIGSYIKGKKMDLEFIIGIMIFFMKEIGLIIANMVKGFFLMD